MVKRLLLFLAVLGSSAWTQTLVQQKQQGGTAVTLTSTPTAGNLLIATIGSNKGTNPAQAVQSITQTNVTWTFSNACIYTVGATNHFRDEIWFGVVGSSPSASATINFNVSPSSAMSNFQEWSGLSTVTQPDTTLTNSNGSSANPTVASFSTRASGDQVIVSVIIGSANSFSADPGAPYTSLTPPTANNHSSYYTNGSGATTAATWTQNGTQYCSVGATFFATGAGPPTGPVNPLVLLGVGN